MKFKIIIILLIFNFCNFIKCIPTEIPYSVNKSDLEDEIIIIFPKNLFDNYENDNENNNDDDNYHSPQNFNKNLENNFEFHHINSTPEEITQYQTKLMKNIMDLTTDPCDDFYQYACGNWEKHFPIPADRSEYNIFTQLNTNIFEAIRDLLSEPPNYNKIEMNSSSSDNVVDAEDKAKLFYHSCINKKLLNERGIEPLINFLQDYGGWPVINNDNWDENNFDWINLTAYSALLGHSIIIDAVIETDLKNSTSHTIYITDPELGLSNRDDYLSNANTKHLQAYTNLIKNTIKLLGVNNDEAEKCAKEIVEFEKKLANTTYDYRKRDDLQDLYKQTTLDEINKINPNVNWKNFLEIVLGIELNSTQRIVLFNSDYYTNIGNLINETDTRIVANYIQWRNVQNFIENLSDDFDKIVQEFNDALTGQKVATARWADCVRETNDNLGMAVGAMFVRNYFDEASKNDVFEITKEMQDVFRGFLKDIDWLDDSTRLLAEEKVNRTTLAVGYPEFILSKEELNKYYENLNVEEGKYFENALRLHICKAKKSRTRLFENVDKNEWPMHPAVVNAFFEQTKNRIVIPAGILHPPIYHRIFPRFLNYGAIGAVIGHELTHGFDDIGRSFDLNGNMNEWWTNNSIQAFHKRARCFINQYSNFSMHGKSIHGAASRGENIADNGGIRQSYFAYKKWLEDNNDTNLLENEILPGLELTGPQLFFLAFAQAWCGAIRPEAIENRLETDYHCPGRFRVLGTLTNFEEFAKEYQCPAGSRMNPEFRCKMW